MKNLITTRWKSLAVFFGLVLIVEVVGSLTTISEIPTWYASLHKPAWTPPNGAFGPVWTILYIMIAFSGWLLWEHLSGTFNKKMSHPAMRHYFVQLALNFLWSPLFFKFHHVEIALITIIAMIIFTVLTIKHALSVNRTAAYLLIPYLMWISYASTLNVGIVYLN